MLMQNYNKNWDQVWKGQLTGMNITSKRTIERQNFYLYSLIDFSFHGLDRLIVLLFENSAHRTAFTGYFLPKVEIKDYNIIDRKFCFDQPVKNDLTTYDNTQKNYNMTQYNNLNLKSSNSELDKIDFNYGTKVTLSLSSNVIGDSNNEMYHAL